MLTGARPGESGVDLSPQLFKTLSSQLAIGAPQDLLARRPDVQRAERELAAATAGIGIATADFYPHIEVGGFIGFLSGNSADLGTVASQAFSIGPSISWNGLNWKRVQSRLDQSKANADEAFANYQQTVLLALEDIEGSLTLFNTQRERSNHLLEQAQQSRRAADLAGIRYREGATDFLVLLDAPAHRPRRRRRPGPGRDCDQHQRDCGLQGAGWWVGSWGLIREQSADRRRGGKRNGGSFDRCNSIRLLARIGASKDSHQQFDSFHF